MTHPQHTTEVEALSLDDLHDVIGDALVKQQLQPGTDREEALSDLRVGSLSLFAAVSAFRALGELDLAARIEAARAPIIQIYNDAK